MAYKTRAKIIRRKKTYSKPAYKTAGHISTFKPEYKWMNTNIAGTAMTTVPSMHLMSGCIEGTGDLQRIGKQIQLTSIQFKAYIYGPINTMCRICIVKQYSPNGVAPTWADIWQYNTVYSARNKLKIDQFKVLSDRVYIPTTDNKYKEVEIYKRINDTQKYLTDASNIAAIDKTAYWLGICSITDAGANNPTLTGQCQIRFTD